MAAQFLVLPTLVSSVHVAPESEDDQMLPIATVADCCTPSLDIARVCHLFVLPTLVSSVHVAPESLDVQMSPESPSAVCVAPSADIATSLQPGSLALVLSVHVAP